MPEYLNAVIFAAGEFDGCDYKKHENDYVIAADAGYLNAVKIGVEPDLVIGDFDSLGRIPAHDNLKILPKEKDDTDTAYAVKCALGIGIKKIFIFGGLGGRLDHTLANIQMLSYMARRGVKGYLVGRSEVYSCVQNGEMILHGRCGQTVSVFSLSETSSGVYERGFKYTLEDAVIERTFPIGVSNEFACERGEISVKSGELLVSSITDTDRFVEKNRSTNDEIHQKFNIYY